ncbi:MAG: hypothetical protein QNJ54_27100 [Prochloraceae cyanobacterium]|nr:hypothetical protein [Prochloraceae cyanobacterium]
MANTYDQKFAHNLADAVSRKRRNRSSIDSFNFDRLLKALPPTKIRKKDNKFFKEIKIDPNVRFT